jgi:hypothetical protein
MTTTTTFRFKKGQQLHLDEIYDIQGLAGGHWWERDEPDEYCDDLHIVEDITIKIVVTRKSNAPADLPAVAGTVRRDVGL